MRSMGTPNCPGILHFERRFGIGDNYGEVEWVTFIADEAFAGGCRALLERFISQHLRGRGQHDCSIGIWDQ